jgi:hypothetical protein
VGIGIAAFAGIPGYGAAKADSIAKPKVGAYERLSAGNKKIAEALFNGQIATAKGKEPLNLDQIAAARRRNGWGRIFKQLRADGLLDAKNLRELTSGRYQQQSSAKIAPRARKSTVVTTASGRQIVVGKNSLSRQGRRNTGRDKNRRGSKSIGQHTDGLFGSGSTYRGRMDNTAQSGSGTSIGITSAGGVAPTTIISK